MVYDSLEQRGFLVHDQVVFHTSLSELGFNGHSRDLRDTGHTQETFSVSKWPRMASFLQGQECPAKDIFLKTQFINCQCLTSVRDNLKFKKKDQKELLRQRDRQCESVQSSFQNAGGPKGKLLEVQ